MTTDPVLLLLTNDNLKLLFDFPTRNPPAPLRRCLLGFGFGVWVWVSGFGFGFGLRLG
jgi:hypothetical protein